VLQLVPFEYFSWWSTLQYSEPAMHKRILVIRLVCEHDVTCVNTQAIHFTAASRLPACDEPPPEDLAARNCRTASHLSIYQCVSFLIEQKDAVLLDGCYSVISVSHYPLFRLLRTISLDRTLRISYLF